MGQYDKWQEWYVWYGTQEKVCDHTILELFRQEELSQLVQAHPRANQPGWQI